MIGLAREKTKRINDEKQEFFVLDSWVGVSTHCLCSGIVGRIIGPRI
jgi:hypothetical protein